jgi:AcrR family transcriptional regulator
MKTKKGSSRKLPQPSHKRDTQKSQRLKQVLAAAFEVFAAHGYEAARIDDVAERAGIAKGTIYLYFKGKDQLFRAVVRNLIQKPVDGDAGNLSGRSEPMLRELFARMYARVVLNPKARSIIRLLIAESGKFPQLSDIYHREIIAPGMAAVRQIVMKGVAAGEFRKTSAVDFPQFVVAPAVLAIVWRLLHGERHALDLDAYMKAHLDFVLASLRNGP